MSRAQMDWDLGRHSRFPTGEPKNGQQKTLTLVIILELGGF